MEETIEPILIDTVRLRQVCALIMKMSEEKFDYSVWESNNLSCGTVACLGGWIEVLCGQGTRADLVPCGYARGMLFYGRPHLGFPILPVDYGTREQVIERCLSFCDKVERGEYDQYRVNPIPLPVSPSTLDMLIKQPEIAWSIR